MQSKAQHWRNRRSEMINSNNLRIQVLRFRVILMQEVDY